MVQNPRATHLSVVPDDRRERARRAKQRAILEAADSLIAEEGLGAVTMQRVADRLDCAVGTLYLYFPSKAAMVAALEAAAIETLRASYETARPGWDAYLAEAGLEPELDALVLLCAFGGHWASASLVFADEFQLQRSLLTERLDLTAEHAVRDVLPVLLRLLDHPAALLDGAAEVGAIERDDERARSLRWLAAMNGVLLLERLAPVDRHLFRAQHLTRMLTHDLLTGWGAERGDVEVAASHVERLATLGPLAPPPDLPGFDT